jgi:hypothetical protein
MTDPQQAEFVAAQRRQQVKERRVLGAAALAVVLLSAAPLWLGAVLRLAVRLLQAAAGWGS